MRFKKLLTLGLVSFQLCMFCINPVYAGGIDGIISCSKGDVLNITLDNGSKEVNWVYSNKKYNDYAKFDGSKVTIMSEGIFDIENKSTGYKIRVVSKGSTKNGSTINLSYGNNDEIEKVVQGNSPKINGKSAKIVELGDELSTNEINTKEKLPKGFKETKDNNIKAVEEGTYVLNDEVIQVVEPVLNKTKIVKATGWTDSLSVENSSDIAVKTFLSTDSSVATVDEYGNVALVGEGECDIIVNTTYNELKCHVVSIYPTVNEDDVKIKSGESYQVEVEGNDADLPVSYDALIGKGTITPDGKVKLKNGEDLLASITVGDKQFLKYFYTEHQKVTTSYWDAMQPAIMECLGTPYVFGGEEPGIGLDCSAYVSYVYKTVGLLDTRLTAQGLYDITEHTDDPRPGDMIFFKGTYNCPDYITHVGIYAGDGMMYHSGNPNQKSSFETSYWQKHLVGFGTMVKDDLGTGSDEPLTITDNDSLFEGLTNVGE